MKRVCLYLLNLFFIINNVNAQYYRYGYGRSAWDITFGWLFEPVQLPYGLVDWWLFLLVVITLMGLIFAVASKIGFLHEHRPVAVLFSLLLALISVIYSPIINFIWIFGGFAAPLLLLVMVGLAWLIISKEWHERSSEQKGAKLAGKYADRELKNIHYEQRMLDRQRKLKEKIEKAAGEGEKKRMNRLLGRWRRGGRYLLNRVQKRRGAAVKLKNDLIRWLRSTDTLDDYRHYLDNLDRELNESKNAEDNYTNALVRYDSLRRSQAGSAEINEAVSGLDRAYDGLQTALVQLEREFKECQELLKEVQVRSRKTGA